MKRFFLSLALYVLGQAPAIANETIDELECWKETDPASHIGALCAIKRNLESIWELELRNTLEKLTDLKPGEINDVVPRLFVQWAECKYKAVIDFSLRRSDIPLRFLLAGETNAPISDDELIWMNHQLGFEPLNAALEKCENEWGGTVRSYLPESLYAE